MKAATTNHIRFSDAVHFASSKRKDFVVRRRTTVELIYSLFLALIAIIAGVSFLVYNDMWMGSMLVTVAGVVMLFVALQMGKLRHLLRASEFMNAILASALGSHYQFCMLVKQNGEAVYLDRGFYATFPDFLEQPSRTLESWLDLQKVKVDERKKIVDHVRKNEEEKMVVSIAEGSAKIPQDILLYIEPIARPAGFVLLRGKEIS